MANKIPQEWKNSSLIPLFIKGDKLDLRNYRRINILNTTLKVPMKIITKFLSNTIEWRDEQQGV